MEMVIPTTATAYGTHAVDESPDSNSTMFKGCRENKLIIGISVAANKLPYASKVDVYNKKFGFIGTFVVHDTGGSKIMKNGTNMDFFAGADKKLYKYFASLGKIKVLLYKEHGPSVPFKSTQKKEAEMIAPFKKTRSIGDFLTKFPQYR
jgi:3D (Asp-Asp-Asp) domain-containing protein